MSIDIEKVKARQKAKKDAQLEAEDKTTEFDRSHNPEDSIMENEDLPEYPFTDVEKQKKKEPKQPQPSPINP